MVGLEEIKMANAEMLEEYWKVFVEGKALVAKWNNVKDIIARMELAWQCRYRFKRPRYCHTSIEPKRQNRTRKKQRLTRLQRRAKRQK